MSFDLCVWRENRPITAAQALRTYRWLCGDGSLADADEAEFGVEENERVDAFHTELLNAYPSLEGLETAEADASPWSMTPSHLPGFCVIMMMGFSDARDVAPVVTELAMRHGLVCYDPQAMRIHNPPEIVDSDGLRLEFCDGGIVNAPRPEDLPELLSQITDRNWFAGLERRPGWFMQVGIGERAGKLPDGVFGLEYREGDEDRHFRVLVSDLDEVVHAFQGYAEGDERWKTALDWQPLVLPTSKSSSGTNRGCPPPQKPRAGTSHRELAFWHEPRLPNPAKAEERYQQILADEHPVPLEDLDQRFQDFVHKVWECAPQARIFELDRSGDEPLFSRLGIAVSFPAELTRQIYPHLIPIAINLRLLTYDRTRGFVMGD